MKSPVAALFCLLASGLAALAQGSPEIRPDGSVAFHLKAPKAQEVVLRGQWMKDPLPFQRGEGDVWSVEAPAVRGIWEYSFVVDGVAMIDPGNTAIKPMREPRTSILDLPSTPPAAWDFQEVPHGAVHLHTYLSQGLKKERELWVYTPPGYEKDLTTTYPLLVLQHGSGDNARTWVQHGHAHWIFDNLIAAGSTRPMVVVMIDGHPLGQTSTADPIRRGDALQAFEHELLDDAIPLVEARYRVKKEPANRGIVGLSMGGQQSLTVGLSHPELFAWIGSFSGVPPSDAILQPLLADSAAANSHLRLLWLGVGRSDFLRERNEAFEARLKAAGIEHRWVLSDGGHEWPVWRRYLTEFAPLLFRTPSRSKGPGRGEGAAA